MFSKLHPFALAAIFIMTISRQAVAFSECPIKDIYNDVTSFCVNEDKNGITYKAETKGKMEPVGCLADALSPAWFIMKIEEDGDLELEISHSSGHDVDFACWGPFEGNSKIEVLKRIEENPSLLHDPGNTKLYPRENMVDCSYDYSKPVEYCQIPNAKRDEWYLVVITNYTLISGDIRFVKSSGSATTNCDIIIDASSPSPFCEGETIRFFVGTTLKGSKYHWTGPNGFQSNQKEPLIPNASESNAGTYYLQVEHDGNTSPLIAVDVEVKQKKHTDTTVTINLGESFKFGSQRLYSQGIYFDTLAASTGCDSTVRLNLIVNNEIKVSNTGPYCEGEAVRITAENLPGKISSLIWEGPAGFSSKSVSPTVNNAKPQNSGTYTCFLNVNNQKVKAGETEVVVLSSPNIKVHEKIPVDSFFTFEDTTIKTPGTYTFKLTAENGCDSTISLVLTPEYHELIPSSFLTPNNDGFNDTWFITNIDKVPAPTVSLYDRSGKIVRVIEEYNNANGWDGKDINGNPLPSSDYWYIIDIEGFDKIYTGHVTLLR